MRRNTRSTTRSGIIRMIVSNDHFIDLTEDLVRQTLPELNKERWYIWCFLLISRQTNEELVIRVLRDLFNKFPVGIVVLFLNNQ